MPDIAEGNAEGRASLVADSTQTAARAEDCPDGSEKPYFYDTGLILGRISRLHGYSYLLSGLSFVFLSGFSSLPLTKWNDEGGIPQADVGLVSVLLKLWIGTTVSEGEG